jgi:colanic acid/amylovoran biosynthesis protein
LIIEIRGVQFVNKGAELMLHAVLEKIQQYFPKAQIALAPNKNSPYQQRALLGALQKLPLRFRGYDFNTLSYYLPQKLRGFLRHWLGVVFEVDVDLVLDASGFAYGDQWGGRNIKVLCEEIERLAKHQKGYILLPQAFGPFSQATEQQLLARALPKAWFVCARDSESYQHLSACVAGTAALHQFADFTNLVTPVLPAVDSNISHNISNNIDNPAEGHIHKKPRCLIIPNAAMVSSKNRNQSWRERYLAVLKLAIDTAQQQGMTAVLLNHEGDADADICQQLSTMFNPPLPVIAEPDPRKVKGWIATSSLVVCSRFHGCVSALSSGVPCIGTSWSHKYEALFSEYQQPEFLINADVTAPQLAMLFQQSLQKVTEPQVVKAIADFKMQSETMWQQLVRSVVQHQKEMLKADSDRVQ